MDKLRFLHIPKTAGSTFWRILNKQYRGCGHFVFSGDNPSDKEKFLALTKSKQDAIGLFTGHAPIVTGLEEADEIPIITILRNPISRVKSFCQHVSEGKSPHLLNSFPPESFKLDEFLFSGNSELSNLQSRMLINYEKSRSGLLVGELSSSEIKDKALENLLEKVTCFGLQEYFDESLILFASQLGWRIPLYETFNKKNTSRLLEFNERHIEKIIELNTIDLEFYEEARKRFINIINSPNYNKDKLETFKRVQRIASPILRIYGLTRRKAIQQLRSVYKG